MGKTKHKISNCKQYNQALINRISVTSGINSAAIKAVYCLKHHGHSGRGFIIFGYYDRNGIDGERYFQTPTSWIRRLPKFGSYVDGFPAEIPYIYLH